MRMRAVRVGVSHKLALKWPSIRARVLCIKLAFLLKLLTRDDTLSSRVFRSLSVSGIESLHLVRQHRFLESIYESNLTSSVITSPSSFSIQSLKHKIIDQDFTFLLDQAASDSSLKQVFFVAVSTESSWPKVWDTALDKGPPGTLSALAMLKLFCLRTIADNQCPSLAGPHPSLEEAGSGAIPVRTLFC